MREMTVAWSSVVSVTSQVMLSGLNTVAIALLLLDAVARAWNLDRHPDEVAGLHQAVVDQILRPALADDREIAADIGVEVDFRVRRVEVDDRNARGARFLDDLDEAAGVGARGHDRVGLGGDGGADRLLLRGDVAVVERGLDGLAGVLRPHVRPGEEIGPHRIGGRAVRNPVESLGLRPPAAARAQTARGIASRASIRIIRVLPFQFVRRMKPGLLDRLKLRMAARW